MKAVLLLAAAAVSLLWAQSEDATAQSLRARELVSAGKLEEAIAIYRELALAHPSDAGTLVNLSIVEFKAKRYRDAAEHANAAVRLQPGSIPANLFLGSSYVELGEYSLAVTPLEKVLSTQPGERNARLMLAEALLNLGRYDGAAEEFQRARELAPANPKIWYGLGRTFDALSEAVFRRMENDQPESPYFHVLRADFYLKQRRYGSAFADYRAALKELGSLPSIHAGLAIIYRRTGHADWAQIEEQREREAVPDCGAASLACNFASSRFQEIIQTTRSATAPEARYWACKAYTASGREAYDQLMRLPPSLEAHVQKAKTFDGQGSTVEAAAEWREALQLAPGDLTIGTALAWSLFRAHEFRAALPVLDELLTRNAGSCELHFLSGAILLNLDELDKAIPLLESATRLDGNFLPAHAALGQALLQAGQPSRAIPHLQAALAADDDASTHFRLFRAYQLSGQEQAAAQAKTEYEKARQQTEAKAKVEEGGNITGP
jgi:predicted Zn-dependent protease